MTQDQFPCAILQCHKKIMPNLQMHIPDFTILVMFCFTLHVHASLGPLQCLIPQKFPRVGIFHWSRCHKFCYLVSSYGSWIALEGICPSIKPDSSCQGVFLDVNVDGVSHLTFGCFSSLVDVCNFKVHLLVDLGLQMDFAFIWSCTNIPFDDNGLNLSTFGIRVLY